MTTEEDRSTRIETYITASLSTIVLLMRFIYEGIDKQGPPLWSNGQSFWLQIQRSRVRFQALPVGLERGPLSLVRSIEELLE